MFDQQSWSKWWRVPAFNFMISSVPSSFISTVIVLIITEKSWDGFCYDFQNKSKYYLFLGWSSSLVKQYWCALANHFDWESQNAKMPFIVVLQTDKKYFCCSGGIEGDTDIKRLAELFATFSTTGMLLWSQSKIVDRLGVITDLYSSLCHPVQSMLQKETDKCRN